MSECSHTFRETQHLARLDACIHCGMLEPNHRIAELEKVLTEIAACAHHGGLLDHISDPGSEIRKLTLPYWDSDECDRLQMAKVRKIEGGE